MSARRRSGKREIGAEGSADRAARLRAEQTPLWRQALIGIGLVTAGAMVVVALGVLLATVVAWLA